MNLKQLIIATLHELQRPVDSATVAQWQERLTLYINEAIADVGVYLRPWRRNELAVTDGRLDLSQLPYLCTKVLAVEDGDGRRLAFYDGASVAELIVKNVPDPTLYVVYRYAPRTLHGEFDEPELPAFCHPLIVTYAVARERCHMDGVSQGSAQLNFTLYETQKRRLRHDFDEPSGYGLCIEY